MNTNIKTAAKLAAFAGAFALTGCAFVPDTVHPTYTLPANVTKVPGADKVVVDVIVKNEKKRKNEVSVTKDGYGFKMAGVYMHVADDFYHAISSALEKEGFSVAKTGTTKVKVDVLHFFLPEQMHFWSASHTGHGSMYVTVVNGNGDILYQQTITVKKIYFDKKQNLSNFNLTSAGRSESVKILMTNMVDKLISDNGFTNAMLQGKNARIGVVVPAGIQ